MKNTALRLIITATIAFGLYYTLGEPLTNFWHMCNGFVALPILIIFFALWSLQMSMANKWKFNRLALLPCLIGIYECLWRQGFIISFIADYMSTEHELPMSNEGLVFTGMSGISASYSALLLGTGLSLALYMICVCATAIQAKPKE